MNLTEPSQKAKLQPPGWKLLAPSAVVQSPALNEAHREALVGQPSVSVDGVLAVKLAAVPEADLPPSRLQLVDKAVAGLVVSVPMAVSPIMNVLLSRR